MLNYGTGVSRTLSPAQRQFVTTIMQKGKPPMDADTNLASAIQFEALASVLRGLVPSGFFIDPTRSRQDFITNPDWSNQFYLGNPSDDDHAPVVWAVVNGWLVPVCGTHNSVSGDVRNRVRLYPPPSSDSRVDFVFLEVWQAVLRSNPSTVNKPTATTIWKYGNVEYGQTNLDDDLVDGAIGRETSRRVQLQYRLRVFGRGSGLAESIDLSTYPDGLDDPNVLGQGTATSPQTGFPFSNMRNELGDASLWRAGDGDPDNSLGTVDGFVYAIPVCAVFRRNSSAFTAVNLSGSPNNNGALNRSPSASLLTFPPEGAKSLSQVTLAGPLSATATGVIQVNGLQDSGLDDPGISFSNVFIKIGEELLSVSSVDASSVPGTITVSSRGRGGSQATVHQSGDRVSFYNPRPDGLFSDQISDSDILDMRRGVSPGDWDYQRMLFHNLTKLANGTLQTTHKKSATGNTQGVLVSEVSLLHADGSVAPLDHTVPVDGPDGIRTVFSDAACLQTDVTLLLDPSAPLLNGFTTDQFDSTVSWDVGADFKPAGFLNNLGAGGAWRNGSSIFLHIGGDSGSEGARATFRDGTTRAVRFVSPYENWLSSSPSAEGGNQYPVTLKFLDQYAMHPIAPGEDPDAAIRHPGPYYPMKEISFLSPFVFLGGLLHPSLRFLNLSSDSVTSGTPGLVSGPNGPELDLGIDFDAQGGFFSGSGGFIDDDPSAVAFPLLRGQRTLYDMLTDGGRDRSGRSSEVFVVLWGDTGFRENNGLFMVVGAGTVGYTSMSASNSTSVVLTHIGGDGFTDFVIAPGRTVSAEFRSKYTNVEDGDGFASGVASAVIVLTDMEGDIFDTINPWNSNTLGAGSSHDYSIPPSVTSKLQVNCTLQYDSGRGATARVPDEIWRVSLVEGGPTYLRQPLGGVDSSFAGANGIPAGETFFDSAHVQLWNRLPSRGYTESSKPKATDFGGNVVGFSEQDREAEVFIDKGSKTLVLRPFQDKNMTLQAITTRADPGLLGTLTYPSGVVKDGAGIFTTGQKMAFPVPSEYMPRFGRLDIPYHRDLTGTGSGTFLEGINHLFTDSGDPTEPQFYVIGGQDNGTGGNLVRPMYFQTGSASGHAYGVYGTIAGPSTPAYQARLTTSIGTLTAAARDITERLESVQSSDLGAGLKGIQLPPYLGVARLYGVYDRADFIAKGGQTFSADRIVPAADPPTNLLRKDASVQTLFIFKDGARDITQSAGDHTYIIPSDAVDITLSPSYAPGVKDKFESFDFVVECAVFGFARGWINENNYVLARRHNGSGTLVQDGDDPEIEGVRMTIPSPAVLNDRFYVGYNRTPYQGDPYMTREGDSRTTSDYASRYGRLSPDDAVLLATPIQQYDSDGNVQVETPNARGLEILASVDFYTTLGTGNIGGAVFPGTVLDVGYLEDTGEASSRIPGDASDPSWRTLTRAFSQGQAANPNRASITLVVDDFGPALDGVQITFTYPSRGLRETLTGAVTPVGGNQFDAGLSEEEFAANLVDSINGTHPINSHVFALQHGRRVVIYAVPVGAEGNNINVSISGSSSGTSFLRSLFILDPSRYSGPEVFIAASGGNLSGGQDILVNAGDGTTQLRLTGMTERLPLGILLQDCDFLGENPLNDAASAFRSFPSGIRPVQSVLPLTQGGNSYDRFFGDPGQVIGLSDGAVLRYAPYHDANSPSGTKRFRIYRGGGAGFVMSGANPGGPIDWVSESFPASFNPVLKGGILACKALLVRNYPERAFSSSTVTSHGDEIQMVILTYGILGNGRSLVDGIQLDGVLSPTGYGEGYAAADRYRIEGRPMYSGYSRKVQDPVDVTLAVYPGRE